MRKADELLAARQHKIIRRGAQRRLDAELPSSKMCLVSGM
jgi:hypothetical protein